MQSYVSSQDTGYFLISRLVDELSDLCGGEENRSKLEARIAAVMALYEVRPKKSAAGHPDVIEKMEQFLAAKKLEGYSPVTLKTYELNLKIFAENVIKPATEITTQDIRSYLAGYEHLKPRTNVFMTNFIYPCWHPSLPLQSLILQVFARALSFLAINFG